MNSVVCTLFEGHYHYGLATLVNSLYKQGYRGEIYAGHKGTLPNWASESHDNFALKWKGARTMHVIEGVDLHFLPLDTAYHLTNYKPDFMLQLWHGPAANAKSLFYFDPDIVITAPWSYFLSWTDCGVALCEDVNSPLEKHHPRRVAWRNFFNAKGFYLSYKSNIYVNGGFVGVAKGQLDFINHWKNIQESMGLAIGGLSNSAFKNGKQLSEEMKSDLSPFNRTDQDALNAAIESSNEQISFIGKEGMAFKSGVNLMPHALGQPKPWQIKPILRSLKGKPPRLVDKLYWKNANNGIVTHSKLKVRFKTLSINIAAIIGRFYCNR